MNAQDAEVDDHQHEALASQRGKERKDAKIPDLGWIDLDDASSALGKKERKQYTRGCESAVGRNEESADVEEDWMHQSQNTVLGRQRS